MLSLVACQPVTQQAYAPAAPEPCCGYANQPQVITVVGYAPISLQPGQNQQHKILMAMRASKLQAYQELAAVVHGQVIQYQTGARDMVLQGEQLQSAVSGIVRGARVVKTYPVQEDVYATVLELDVKDIQRAYVRM